MTPMTTAAAASTAAKSTPILHQVTAAMINSTAVRTIPPAPGPSIFLQRMPE
jgi:hypothetical protein